MLDEMWQSYGRGEYEECVRLATAVLESNPSCAEALRGRSEGFRMKRELKRALNDVNFAIAIDPNNADGYLSRGLLRHDMNEFDHCVEDLSEAIALGANRAFVFRVRAAAQNMRQRFTEALRDATHALVLSPDVGRLVLFE